MQPEIFFYIIVLVYSIILHEIAHGWAAYIFGDKTAFYNNRLTLNPVPHVDPIGSLLIPAFLIMSSSPMMFGWAKPVPVAEHNLNPYRLGKFVVAVAGIMLNFTIAIVFTIIGLIVSDSSVKQLSLIVALTNSALGVFNLIPFPPADGYRIIENFLPLQLQRQVEHFLQQYFLATIIGAIILASFIFRIVFPPISNLIYSLIF